MVSIEHFFESELIVAEIIDVKPHPNADRLYLIRCSLGNRCKQIVAGIRQFYTPDQLVGKSIIIVDNLKPHNIRGIKSFGMLLAGKHNDQTTVAFINNIPAGTRLG